MKKTVNTLNIENIPEFNNIFRDISLVKNLSPNINLVLKEIRDADAYLASANIEVNSDFLRMAKKLKVIGSPSTGTDHMDMELIKKKGIICYDLSKEYKLLKKFTATSELAFSLGLNVLRKIIPATKEASKGIWSREKFTGHQLYGKTFGIIGLGRLGRISARIAKGFGMKIIAYDIKKKNIQGIRMVNLFELARCSDLISIHVHLNSDTEKLIDKSFFNLMKKNSIIINTSRGRIINEEDLLKALKDKKIAGAGLDVIDGEWLSNSERAEHKLIKFSKANNNLVITPHIGGSTTESINDARIFMAKKVARFLKNL